MVDVKSRPDGEGWTCEVRVEHGGRSSQHTVRVLESDLARWGRETGQAGVDDLVRRSFEFLLQREPPGSILRRFELAVIPRYFPEYDAEFRSPP